MAKRKGINVPELASKLRALAPGQYLIVESEYERQTASRCALVAGLKVYTEKSGRAFKVHRLAD